MIPITLRRSLALGAGLLALSLLAAVPPASPPSRFEESTQVVAVDVPVNAVDRDGGRGSGLTARDFEVFEEGAKQTITHFEVVDLDALRPEQSPSALRPGAIGTVDDLEALDSAVRRHFMLVFDISFSSPTAVLKARLAARDFVLHSLRPSDLVAVATYSLETGPRLVLTFTPDRAQLAHATLRFVIAPPATVGVDASLASLSGIGASGAGSPRQEAQSAAASALLDNLIAVRAAAERDQRAFQRNQIFSYTRSLASLAKALTNLKGRKTVVYFSEGFDSHLMLGREDLASGEAKADELNVLFGNTQLVDNDQRYGNTQLQAAVSRMLEEFRRADCVIQAIDIGGLRAASDATDAPKVSGQEALFYIANETGGELYKDANNFRQQLDPLLHRRTRPYLPAFQRSDLKADGAYHRLRVKVRPAGVRLSYRAGYYAPRPYKDLDPFEKNLLAAEGIASAVPRSDLDVNLLVAPFRSSEQRAYVPVIVEVSGPSLLAGGQRSDKLGLELYAYVIDRQG